MISHRSARVFTFYLARAMNSNRLACVMKIRVCPIVIDVSLLAVCGRIL
jgi:hypothetical protein